MVVFNYTSRELTTKVVYYGPGLCGKTTNLQFIYESMPQGVRGKMLSLATTGDRTLFFDFLPLDLGQIQGMTTKVQLYTVPGQVFYNETRRLVLKGADGIVFVADSQEKMLEANLDSFRNLEENLRAHGMDPADTPLVLQFNKRDLPDAMDVDSLNEALNRYNAPFYEAIATTGVGVQETLRHITKLVLLKLNERYADGRAGAARAAAPPPPSDEAPIALSGPADEAPLAMGAPAGEAPASAEPVAAADPDFDLGGAPAPEPALPEPVAPEPVVAEAPVLEPAASVQNEIPTIAAPIPQPETPAFEPEPAPPEVASEPARPASPAVSSAAATMEPGDDVLGLPVDLAARAASAAEDEDVLGVAPKPTPAPEPAAAPTPEPVVGTTLKIGRDDLASLIEQESTGSETAMPPAASEPSAPNAQATMTPVGPDDALFNEAGVEPTRLAPGQPQEIMIPIQIDEKGTTRRFRLTLFLELEG